MGIKTLLHPERQYLILVIEERPDVNMDFKVPVVNAVQSGQSDSPEKH